MRTTSISLICILLGLQIFAQKHSDTLAAYKLAGIPFFKMTLLPDSVPFVNTQLEKKRQTIIMIFSPDCDHCIRSVKDLLAHADLFKKVQIILATPLSFPLTLKFYREYGMEKYENIKVGTLNDFALGNYFNMHSYPGIFLFNKKGRYKSEFKRETTWEKFAEKL